MVTSHLSGRVRMRQEILNRVGLRQETPPVRLHPAIDEAPRHNACAATDAQVLSVRGTQAFMPPGSDCVVQLPQQLA